MSSHAISLCLLLIAASSLSSEASVPMLFCTNEGADQAECQEELASAHKTLSPWFARYDHQSRRTLLDCRRFCDDTSKYLTFHMPCQCDTSSTTAKAVNVPLPGALEGPIQMFEAFVETLPEGRCKENLAEMGCFVTFVSSYVPTESHHIGSSGSAGVHFLDMEQAGGSSTGGSSTTTDSKVETSDELSAGVHFLDDEGVPLPTHKDPSFNNEEAAGIHFVDNDEGATQTNTGDDAGVEFLDQDGAPTHKNAQNFDDEEAAGVHFLDNDADDAGTSKGPNYDISFDDEDSLEPKVPKEHASTPVGGDGRN